MNTLFGQEKLPLIIIHGGASPIDPKGEALKEALASIQNMADACMKDLIKIYILQLLHIMLVLL